MPRVSQIQTNFTAGEISPRLYGRTDIDRYANAAKRLLNAYPVVHGGARRRAGTRYFKPAKIAAKRARLIPFVVSQDAAYMLEVGDTYLRVHGAGGADLGIELATPYTEAMLGDIDYGQGADTMFLAHPSVAMQRLRRLSSVSFDLSAVPFTTQPFEEQGHKPAAGLTLSAASVGAGRTVTADAGVFLPTDVGRVLLSGKGQATITGFTSNVSVTADVVVAFAGVALANGSWTLDASPQALLKPSLAEPAGSTVLLHAARWRESSITLSAKTGAGITVTAAAAVFDAGDVGRSLYADNGVAVITAFTDAQTLTADVTTDFASTTYEKGGYGITADAFRATEDLGAFVRVNNGLCRITGFNSAATAVATIVTKLDNIIAAPALAWSVESSVWSAANGYPRTVTLHEQRLVAAGSTRYPQTLWGSRIGEYLDFTKGTNDDDAYSFTLASDEVNPISYVASLRNLVVHTYGGEFSVQGGVEKPVTPTNVRVRPESTHGSRGVRPVTVGSESVFVQRAGRKVRAMGYRYDQDGYSAPDLAVLAEHITSSGIVSMAYQQEPDMVLWAVRGDGALISCTMDREQTVTAWAAHYTDGAFESVATLPNGDREEVWVVVRRLVNGQVVRYLEIFDDSFAPQLPGPVDPNAFPPVAQPVVYGTTVDCGVVFDNAGGQTVFPVPHLVGKTVDIVADGAVMQRQLVPAGGNVQLPRASYRTLIGLPFRSEIGLLTPEVGTGTGTSQGNSMRTSEISLRFLDTIGALVLDGDGTEQDVPWRRFGEGVLDEAPAPFTGSVRIETLGWDRGRSEFTIVQDQPLPMHLQSVVRKFQIND